MTKISNLSSPDSFFQAQNAPKSVFAPDPTGSAYDGPPNPLVGWGGGYPLPIPLPTRRLRRLGSQTPSRQNPGYASDNGHQH